MNAEPIKRQTARRGYAEGSIYFRESDGKWVGSVSLGYGSDGKRRRKTIYGETKNDVAKKVRALQSRADTGRLTDAGSLTVAQWLARWLDSQRSRLQPKTHLRYEQLVRLRIIPHLGGTRIASLQPLHVQQFYATMHSAGVSIRGQQMAGRVLHKSLRDAVRLHVIPSNPSADIEKPNPPKAKTAAYDEIETHRLLAAASGNRLYAMFVLAIDSGMRQGELFALSWPDIDFDANVVNVRQSLEEIQGRHRLKEPKTGNGRRIDVSSFTMDALANHRKAMLAEGHYRNDGPVFCDSAGGWLRKSNVQRNVYRPIQAAAGVPILRFHDLRHTAATLMLLAGDNIKVVSERLGHARVQITLDTYSHVLPTMQKQVAERMDAFFRRTGT